MINGLKGARHRLNRLTVAGLLGFGLIALALSYWAIVRGPVILDRGDNPRLVETELRIRRGSVVDANGQPLARTSGEEAELTREYPLPAAAPAVGYYSLRYGTAGAEESFDELLRGAPGDSWQDYWQYDVLNEPQTGGDVRLTLDSRWQQEADALLSGHNGAILLLSLPDASVRAMVSSPGYDPNNLDADFERLTEDEEAPLLNRVTHGQYQPGLLLQPYLLAIALRDGLIDLSELLIDAPEQVVVEGIPLTCQATAPQQLTWAEAMQGKCPGPMLELASRFGSEGLLSALEEFGLLDAPEFAISAVGDPETDIVDANMAALGQDAVAVSPLQIGLGLAALANGGRYRPAQLVLAMRNSDGEWSPYQTETVERQVVPTRIADEIVALFSQHESILEHSLANLSGPAGELNSWYLGLAPAGEPRYAVVVVTEEEGSPLVPQTIGRDLLKKVLNSD